MARRRAVDRLELMQMLLGHMEAELRVDFGDYLLDVPEVRYSPEREGRGAVALAR
jgi:hypothetical protein